MNIAKFLEPYEFKDLQVSGIFDGTLPMVFTQKGGRIVGGKLVSRTGGGELSYLGQLSYANMGVFANYAFSALKSIRYNEMTISIGGDIDGEIITQISFAGLQQGSLAKRNFITKQIAKLPIIFNLEIKAQFLQLIGLLRGIYDDEYAAKRAANELVKKKKPPITGEEEPFEPKPTDGKKSPVQKPKDPDE
jgi:translocation and assembly module TamB